MTERKMFPVLMGAQRAEWLALGCPTSVPWSLLAPHEEQARNNHGQDLAKLASRGGLDPMEMAGVITGRTWRQSITLTPPEAVSILLAALAKEPP